MAKKQKWTTTTPDPEFFKQPRPMSGRPVGENARGEVTGCPTGLTDTPQTQVTQQAGGGGAPGTGAVQPSPPTSPGEGVTEKQIEDAEE